MGKFLSIYKLNDIFLNNVLVKVEILREIRKYFEWNENNLLMCIKVLFGGKLGIENIVRKLE